jgi:hypothetical protein
MDGIGTASLTSPGCEHPRALMVKDSSKPRRDWTGRPENQSPAGVPGRGPSPRSPVPPSERFLYLRRSKRCSGPARRASVRTSMVWSATRCCAKRAVRSYCRCAAGRTSVAGVDVGGLQARPAPNRGPAKGWGTNRRPFARIQHGLQPAGVRSSPSQHVPRPAATVGRVRRQCIHPNHVVRSPPVRRAECRSVRYAGGSGRVAPARGRAARRCRVRG